MRERKKSFFSLKHSTNAIRKLIYTKGTHESTPYFYEYFRKTKTDVVSMSAFDTSHTTKEYKSYTLK